MGAKLEFKGTDRFVINRRLGAGSFGVVYQAYDREREATVALKTLRLSDGKSLYRFKREFRALADVSHHNLVSLYELISDGVNWFFTMELIDGVNFLDYLRADHAEQNALSLADGVQIIHNGLASDAKSEKLNNSSLDIVQLRSCMRQLVDGLTTLHKAGKLHCDIKPSNVLVTPTGRVVILDFGLVTELSRPKTDDESGEFIGTPNYMSPEQALGDDVSEASDWYSVGVMLYEALTGSLPFSGQFFEVLSSKQKYEPPPPSSLVAGLPEDLEKLCIDLLKRDPHKRPTSLDILNRLGEGRVVAERATRTFNLIGRDRHLATLNSAFGSARDGRAAMALLRGESGIGKSDLVRFFLDEIGQQESSVVILTGCCYAQESVPYKALDSLIDSLSHYLRGLSNLEAEAILPHDILALARLFPVLKQVEAVAGAQRRVLEIPDSQELRRRAFAALRELLVRLTDRKPVVLFIDDLQWGDVDSAALLAEIMRPPDPPALLLIASYRKEDEQSSPCLKTLLPLLTSSDESINIYQLDIGELTTEESQALALSLLGNSAGAAERAALIARESHGNPFFIDELVTFTKTCGENGGDSYTKLDDVIDARIQQLPEPARKMLELIAVSGQPLERVAISRAAAIDSNDQSAFISLRTAKMIKLPGSREEDRVETYHDRIRETIINRLAPDKIQLYHRTLATTLESLGNVDPERLMVHFQNGGDNIRAAEYAIDSAERASDALAFDHAAHLYKIAIEICASISEVLSHPSISAQRARRLRISSLQVKLAEALANAGRGAEAAEVYLNAAQSTDNSLELERRAAEQFLVSGRIDEGIETLRSVLKKLGLKMPETPRQSLFNILYQRLLIRLRGLGYRLRDNSQIPPRELLRIDACWTGSLGLSLVDTIRGSYFHSLHLRLALNAGEPFRIARALASEAGFSSAYGSRQQARTEKMLRLAQSVAENIGNKHTLGLVKLVDGVGQFCLGHFRRAYDTIESAEKMLRENCTGLSWEFNTAHYYLLRALFYLGEWDRLNEVLPTLIKVAKERGDLYAETNLRTRMSYLAHLAADEPDRAMDEVSQAIGKWSRQGFHQQHFYHLFAETQIDLYRGNGEVAWQRINDTWRALKRSFLMQAQMITIEAYCLRGRSALAALSANSNNYALLKCADHDANKLEKEGCSWSVALSQLLRAGVAAHSGSKEQAIRYLIRSEQMFDELEMLLHRFATHRCHGLLIGGDMGAQLVAEADAWMAQRKIANPERLAMMLAPGPWHAPRT